MVLVLWKQCPSISGNEMDKYRMRAFDIHMYIQMNLQMKCFESVFYVLMNERLVNCVICIV